MQRLISWRILLLPGIGAFVGFVLGSAIWLAAPTTYTATATLFGQHETVADGSTAMSLTAELQALSQLGTTDTVLKDATARLTGGRTSEDLANMVTVKARLNTTMLDTSATSTSPTEAARLANVMGEAMTRAVAQFAPQDDKGKPVLRMVVVTRATPPSQPSQTVRQFLPAVSAVAGAVGGWWLASRRRSQVGTAVKALRQDEDARCESESA